MKPAVVRPIVVLAVVVAVWGQAPAALAEKGGHNPPTKQGLGGTSGAHITRDNRLQISTTTDTDLANGDVSVFEFVQEFDNLGLLVRQSRTDTVNGVVTDSEETAYTYGSAHRLSRVVTVTDSDGDGPLPPSTRVDTLTRNARHKLISIVTTVDDDSDGTVDSTSTESRTFDKRGRVISTQVDDGAFVTTTSLTYDSHGDILAQTIDTDDLSTPQSPDARDASTATYSQPHNLVDDQAEQLYAFDGQGKAQLQGSFTASFSRNQKGFITGSVQEVDFDGDGQVDESSVSTATYDNQGNFLSDTSRTVQGTDVITSSQVLTNDKSGLPVTEVSEIRLNGALVERAVTTDTRNKFGELTRSVTTLDSDGDGTVDSIETFGQTYDNKARSTSFDDSFTDANGVLLFRETRTSVYGKVTVTDTDQIDSDGDGVADETTVAVFPL